MSRWKPRYYDIGVNFSDSMFQGYYHGSSTRKHPCDIPAIIERAHLFNVDKMLITASTIQESKDHFDLVAQWPDRFKSTAGVHPCSVSSEFYKDGKLDNVDEKLNTLLEIIEDGIAKDYIRAFGEIGLDYDRLHYSSKEQQVEMFKKQLDLYGKLSKKLPLFLHMRSCCDDFINILNPYIESGIIERGNGVVHSFTGTETDLENLLKLGFFISINGCSLKTEENCAVAAKIPIDKLLIETDSPWCEVRKSHASYKYTTSYPSQFYPIIESNALLNHKQFKLGDTLPFPMIKNDHYNKYQEFIKNTEGDYDKSIGFLSPPMIKSRNEPVNVGMIAEILCRIHNITEPKDVENFIDTIYNNSCKLF
ncbi:unnamed protein product [Candida verbasci]|uniref:Uncharacterized protein n=1 Tax=Candida verbasci TaxID=1227364 RepID=A0A9W4TR51_9ASCO|nr:unnamed protein product [Candida verbasci]